MGRADTGFLGGGGQEAHGACRELGWKPRVRHCCIREAVRGLVLLNCAGGMNNKAIVDDWRIKLLLPLLWLIDFLLKQRPIASALFNRVKNRDNLKDILLSVYGNKDAVDDELVEIIRGPADTEGALDAFVSTVTGPPGPSPIALMPRLADLPVLVLWGDRDPFTPIDGPVGKFFSKLPSELPNVTLYMLEGVGHCPHDDRPDLVHDRLLPWLEALLPPAAGAVTTTTTTVV
uniref:AB hydrolase-1 domain-containing protein n=1 Tax=Zea mays TaxID=4577 RepID=A0A804QPM5_MAIZE